VNFIFTSFTEGFFSDVHFPASCKRRAPSARSTTQTSPSRQNSTAFLLPVVSEGTNVRQHYVPIFCAENLLKWENEYGQLV